MKLKNDNIYKESLIEYSQECLNYLENKLKE